MYQPQSLLEAYYSIYEEPINEEYLTEEEQYCYEIAQFLLDEGFTEEEIISLTEEEDFLDILYQIDEAKKRSKTEIRQMGLSGRRTRRMGVEPRQMRGGEAVSASGKKLTGATKKAAEADVEAIRKARAERQAWDSPTPRQQEIARRGRESVARTETKGKMKRLEAEAEKIHQDNKKEAETKKPSKTVVGRIKAGIQAGVERDKKARETLGKVARGVGEYISSVNKSKVARGLGKTSASDEAIQRKARMDAKKSVREDYFDYVADYLLENFEFESEEHFYQTMAALDEETIDNIVYEYIELEEAKGRGGEVSYHKGSYSGTISPGEERRETGNVRSKLVSGKVPKSEKDDLFGGSAGMNLTPKEKLRGKMRKLEDREDDSPRTKERLAKMRSVDRKKSY